MAVWPSGYSPPSGRVTQMMDEKAPALRHMPILPADIGASAAIMRNLTHSRLPSDIQDFEALARLKLDLSCS